MKDSASSSIVIAGKPVSYLLLDDLAEGLDTNWIGLGKILGFSKKRLQKIDTKNERLRDKGMAMLVGWKMRRGDDATVEVLQKALVELGMMDMLELDAGTNYYDTEFEFARIISNYYYLTSNFFWTKLTPNLNIVEGQKRFVNDKRAVFFLESAKQYG